MALPTGDPVRVSQRGLPSDSVSTMKEADMAHVDDYDAALGARTQSLFRQVNEGVRQINEAFSDFLPHGDWSCECANPSCDLRIALTADEYERIRSEPTHFAVAAGDVHVFHPIESVLE